MTDVSQEQAPIQTEVDVEEEQRKRLFYTQKQPLSLRFKSHFLASVLYLWFTMFGAFTLSYRWIGRLFSRSSKISSMENVQQSQHRQIDRIDCSSFSSIQPTTEEKAGQKMAIKQIDGIRARKEPLILTNLPDRLFDTLKTEFNTPEDFEGQMEKGKYLIMDQWIMPSVGRELTALLSRIYNIRKPVFMARFRGGYKNCVAHIDSGSTCNFYYVNNGSKQVTFIPVEYSEMYKLTPGNDSVFMPGSDDDENFGSAYPEHYKFEVHEGECLLFHNCAILHKFTNVTGKEDIYTIRVNAFTEACNSILWNDMFSYKSAMHVASEILHTRSTREIAYM